MDYVFQKRAGNMKAKCKQAASRQTNKARTEAYKLTLF